MCNGGQATHLRTYLKFFFCAEKVPVAASKSPNLFALTFARQFISAAALLLLLLLQLARVRVANRDCDEESFFHLFGVRSLVRLFSFRFVSFLFLVLHLYIFIDISAGCWLLAVIIEAGDSSPGEKRSDFYNLIWNFCCYFCIIRIW